MTSKFLNKRIYQKDVIEDWIKKGAKNKSELARRLHITRQHTNKLICLYYNETILNPHKNSLNVDKNQEIREIIADKYLKYCDEIAKFRDDSSFRPTFTDFYENKNIQERYEITYRTVCNYLDQSLIYSPQAKRKTKRKIKKLRKELENPKIDFAKLEQQEEINQARKIKPYRGKTSGEFGEVVEIDASQHRWFNNEKFHIYIAIDRRSGMLLAFHIEKEETTAGYCHLLTDLFNDFGLPKKIITDKRRTFWRGLDSDSLMKSTLNELGIELFCSSQATAKPTVERTFRSLQGFLPSYFYKKQINTVEQISSIRPEIINAFNIKYKKNPDNLKNYFRNTDEINIEDALALKYKLKIHKGSYLTFNGQFLAPFNEQNQRMLLAPGKRVILNLNLKTDEYFVKHEGKKYPLKPVSDEDIIDNFQKMISNEQKENNKMKLIQQSAMNALRKYERFLKNKEAIIKQKEKELKNLFLSLNKNNQ